MAAYHYSARDRRGALRTGVATAATAEALAGELRGQGLLILRIDPVAPPAREAAFSFSQPAGPSASS